MAAVMTDKRAALAGEIAASLAAAGITVTAVDRDGMMQVTVRTPEGWHGDKGILASRALESLRPGWGPQVVGANVSVIPA